MKNTVCPSARARTRLPDLLEEAHRGRATIITKRGKPYAAIVPCGQAQARKRLSLLDLEGSGIGCWSSDSAAFVAKMREEWR
jgi:prevent-host-death family protein